MTRLKTAARETTENLEREQNRALFLLSPQLSRSQNIEICHGNACYAGCEVMAVFVCSANAHRMEDKISLIIALNLERSVFARVHALNVKGTSCQEALLHITRKK